jgi:hypothetical protein
LFGKAVGVVADRQAYQVKQQLRCNFNLTHPVVGSAFFGSSTLGLGSSSSSSGSRSYETVIDSAARVLNMSYPNDGVLLFDSALFNEESSSGVGSHLRRLEILASAAAHAARLEPPTSACGSRSALGRGLMVRILYVLCDCTC